MVQLGAHALVGLWVAWSLPLFSPYVLRFSFGTGVYIGCVFPDIDIYAEAIVFLFSPSFFSSTVSPAPAPSLHRTLTHSVVTATLLLILFLVLEGVLHHRKRNLYDIAATNLDDDVLLAINESGSNDGTPKINFRALGIGLYAGIMIHIMLDIVFWFSPVDLLYPLSNYNISRPVHAWAYEPPDVAGTILTVSEPFCFAVFLTVLRVCVSRKLGKWVDKNPEEKRRRTSFSDVDFEHTSMDFSLHSQDEICPLDQKTLAQARPALKASKYLLIFQWIYSISVILVAGLVEQKVTYIIVYSEILFACMPMYCYLSWALRDVILRKTDVNV